MPGPWGASALPVGSHTAAACGFSRRRELPRAPSPTGPRRSGRTL